MKNFTLIALCVAASAGVYQMADAAPMPDLFRCAAKLNKTTKKKAPTARTGASGKYAAKAADAAAIWRSGTQKAYGWNGEDWELVETYEISYNEQGQKTEQTVTDTEGYANRETYTWNENGMLATRFTQVAEEEGGEFTDYSQLKREYDTRLTSFITFNEQQLFSNGNWIPSNCYKQTITRDEAGNVTLMERAVLFQGIYDPTYRLSITYGEDGRAETIVETQLTYDYFTGEYAWVEAGRYTDIEWDRTDGQITGVDDLDDLYVGANRIKSAKVDVDGELINLNVEYYGDDNFVATLISEEDEDGFMQSSSLSYSMLDFSGEEAVNRGWKIETANEILFDGESLEKELITETYIYDPNDLIILEKVEYSTDDFTLIDAMVEGVVEYDEEYGYPLSWTVREYDWEEEEMMESFRAEYSDYTNLATSAIKGIEAGTGDAPVYYNLQGQKVENPATGIYIRVIGSDARKVMIR